MWITTERGGTLTGPIVSTTRPPFHRLSEPITVASSNLVTARNPVPIRLIEIVHRPGTGQESGAESHRAKAEAIRLGRPGFMCRHVAAVEIAAA